MIERSIAEIVGIVAILAAIARLRMIGRFANRFHPVMTGEAGFGNAAMIKSADRPYICGMAGIAFALRGNVVAVLAGGADVVMAACATRRSTLENATLMAGLTGNTCMPPRERKACRKVIKLLFLGGLGGHSEGQGKAHRQKHRQNCKVQLPRQNLAFLTSCPTDQTDAELCSNPHET